MATMSWTIFTVVTVLVVQLCTGEKACSIWPSTAPGPGPGPVVVQRGSSFRVYCTFNLCKCKGSMYSDHPPTLQSHKVLNATTIFLNVLNINKNRTFSCQCKCPPTLDPCGLDISSGYLPERPNNISCIYKVKDEESGDVFCTWNRGRNTFLWNSSMLGVITASRNHTSTPVWYKVSSKGSDPPSAGFTVSRSVQTISVWAQTQNPLGSAESIVSNYTLSDIAMPSTPVLSRPECSSRECVIKVQQPVRTQHLEIQYKAETKDTWTSSPDSGVQLSAVQVRSISSLQPYTLYYFRARSRFSTGLWSQWSTIISNWTQEEAPAEELDVWCAEPASDFKSLRVYWKELNISSARGKIKEYKVKVYSQNSGLVFITNISADARNFSVPFCADWEVTVWACNSKGSSPPARITTHHTKVALTQFKPPQDVHVTADNLSAAISWRKHNTAPPPAAYVVEWYPKGHKLEELRWVRLGGNENQTVITGIRPFECYKGAVYVFYNESSVSRTRFTGVATVESAPAAGPSVHKMHEGNRVKVTWEEIHRSQRGGCVTNYTIYLESDSGLRHNYSVPASERRHILTDLTPALYSLWMTATTAGGEGPAGQKVILFIQPSEESQLPVPLIVLAVIAPFMICLMCLYHSSAVKQRLWVYFQCLMLDAVPDPANSKWAKEYNQEKDKTNLLLQPTTSTATEEEEEPILVDVEELPRQSRAPAGRPPHPTSLSPETEPRPPIYPQTTYIKSFSHDSDSSNHTHTSLDTSTTVDYITSHGPEDLDEEEQEEEQEQEEEEEFVGVLGFFPSHNVFMEPLQFGGKLTLNSVKISCGDFFQNSEC